MSFYAQLFLDLSILYRRITCDAHFHKVSSHDGLRLVKLHIHKILFLSPSEFLSRGSRAEQGPSTPSRLAPPSSLPTLPFNSSLEDFFVPEVKLHQPSRGPKQGVPCSDPMEDLHQRALGQGDPVLLVE